MVLGLRTKSRKDPGVFVEYLISIKELKPWPNNLIPAQCVLLKWENGEQSSGSCIAVVGNDTIMFNESFRLTLTLDHKGPDKFQKNLLEFHVYDARRKDSKNKFLGSAAINLADYGVVKGSVAVGAPFTFKKSSRNEANTVLYATIEPVHGDGNDDDDDENNSSYSSPKTSFSRGSGDKDGSEIDASLASCTDDDDGSSPHLSRAVSFPANAEANRTSPAQNTTNTSPEMTGDEKKGWKHVRLKHSTNEAVLVSEIEKLLREEDKKRQNNNNNKQLQVSSDNEKLNQKDDKRNDAGILETKKQCPEIRPAPMLSPEAAKKQMKLRTNTLALGRKTFGLEGVPKLKQLKSIQLHFDTDESNKKGKDENQNKKVTHGISNKGSAAAEHSSRTEMLEEELREAAALEAAIYSVVAEHSNSVSKVHAPARRLSRFYLHACKASSNAKRASAAKAAVSGLILVSKACGNDVPRLTFWLSNSIVLREIVSQGVRKLNLSSVACSAPGGGEKEKSKSAESSDGWEDPCAFIAALEKFEAWIFSRIVKSVWWQNLTPYMQSTPSKVSTSRKSSGKRQRSSHKNQGLYSIDLWKNAFKAACESLCPLRGVRQDCGCLPMLAKLAMEQLVSRLDVTMFNAILRESADEMPTDPLSDPISDITVLPIPAGKASFGAGAQLKNATGTWSRWLADQFDSNEQNPESENFRLFHLLNALGDLMMLPFKMLADRSTRKEVCPLLGPLIIKRVLRNFVPDEFNPHRTPRRLFDVLSSEDSPETDKRCITSFPCAASPTVYSIPAADSVKHFIGEFDNPCLSRTGSSVFKKAYTSEDELDDLDIAINSVFSASAASNASQRLPTGNGRRKAVRYQLLREIWRDDEL